MALLRVPGVHATGAAAHSQTALDLEARRSLLSQRAYVHACITVLALAAAIRWLMVLRSYLLPNSDQAIVGLIARHILAGERPVFYWGQTYNGTLESYVTAAVFRLCGSGYVALHVAPVAFSLLFVGATMAVAHRLYGRRTALLSGIFLALGPAVLMEFSVWPGYNYLEAMAFGTLALALVLPVGETGNWWRLPPAAFLLGLALWAQPLAVAYLPALIVPLIGPAFHAWRHRSRRLRLIRAGLLALAALALALWPAIDDNLHTQAASLRFLISRPNNLHLTLLEEARRLVLWAGPVLTGLIPPNSDPAAFQRFLRDDPLLYALALALLGLGLLFLASRRRTLWRWCASIGTERPAGEAALLALAIALLGGYLFSTWSSSRWSATEPRYLLPMYTLTPMLIAALVPAGAPLRRLAWGGSLGLVMLIAGLAANGAAPQVGDLRPLAVKLQADSVQAVYGDYWMVYRLAFVSDERLIPVVTTSNLALGLNRYPPYVGAAAKATSIAWIVPARSTTERALVHCIEQQIRPHGRTPLRRFTWQVQEETLAIYDHLPPTARCVPLRDGRSSSRTAFNHTPLQWYMLSRGPNAAVLQMWLPHGRRFHPR